MRIIYKASYEIAGLFLFSEFRLLYSSKRFQRHHHGVDQSGYQKQREKRPVDVLPFVVLVFDGVGGMVNSRKRKKEHKYE